MMRNAITSVALPGEPVETRLPFRSAILAMPLPSIVTTCIRFGYRIISVFSGTLAPLNLSSPRSASWLASVMAKAMYGLPLPTSLRLSTEPPVTSAVACMPGTCLDSTAAMPPPIG